MGNNGFIIVLIVVVVAIGAGFLYSDNNNKQQQIEVAGAALNQSVQHQATLEAQNKQMANAINEKDAKIAQLQEQVAAQAEQNRLLAEKLNAKTAQEACPIRLEVMPTAAPVNSARGLPPIQAEQAFSWLAMAGAGLFGMVVFAAYRILRVDERPQTRAPRSTADNSADTVYVRMTREQARRYARGKGK